MLHFPHVHLHPAFTLSPDEDYLTNLAGENLPTSARLPTILYFLDDQWAFVATRITVKNGVVPILGLLGLSAIAVNTPANQPHARNPSALYKVKIFNFLAKLTGARYEKVHNRTIPVQILS